MNPDTPRSRAKQIAIAAAVALGIAWSLAPRTTASAKAAVGARNGEIVFAVGQDPTRQQLDGSFLEFNLFSVSPTGEGLRQITSAPGVEISPAWAPDGLRIAFSGGPNLYASMDIQIVEVASGETINLTNSPTSDEYSPDWSPDGKRLVFASALNAPLALPYPAHTVTNDYDLYVMNADGREVQRLTESTDWDSYPAWSPSGDWIAYMRDGSIALISPDGSKTRLLVNQLELGQGLYDPEWSPDGRKLLFATAAPDTFEIPLLPCACDSDVWVVNVDGSGLRNLTAKSDAHEYAAAWSPDGRRIVFTSNRTGARQPYLMNPDGSNVVPLIDLQLDSGGAGLDWGPRP
ncbi:MAG TPA: hypothetical protein VHJ82_09905 [Actinomycetota bacterium]|nr:hypothetical protein [Actinomycetota bacterium]